MFSIGTMKSAIVFALIFAVIMCLTEAQVPNPNAPMGVAKGGVEAAAGAGGQIGAQGEGAADAAEGGPGASMSAGFGAGSDVGASAKAEAEGGAGRRR